MTKQYKVLVNTGKAENNKTIDVQQHTGDKGQPARIKAQAGAKYQLQELGKNKNVAPDYVRAKRNGKNLEITFENGNSPDLIIEDYYSEMAPGYNGVIGQAENGGFYEYIPEDPKAQGLIPELADGARSTSVALGGAEVTPVGAAVAVAAFPMLGALGVLGAGAAAAYYVNKDAGNSTPIVGALASSSDTGALGDNRTSDSTPTLSGKVPAGATATVTIQGQTYPVTVSPDGSWTFTQPTNLPDGTYTPILNVTQNGVTTPTALTPFTIDTVTNVDITNPGRVGALDAISGTAEPGDSIVVKDANGNVIGTTTAGADGQWSLVPTSALPSGTLSATAADAAGNTATDTATPTPGSVQLPTAPITGALAPVSDNMPGTTPDDNKTNDATPVLAGTVPTGTLAANVVLEGQLYPATIHPDGSWSAPINKGNLPDGTYYPVLVTTSPTGAITQTNLQPFTIDTTPANVVVTSNATALAADETAQITFTLSEAVTDFTASDVTVSGGTLSGFAQSATNPLVYTATFTPTPGSTPGTATISVGSQQFSDTAGNLNTDGAEANNSVSLATGATVTGSLAPASDSGVPGDDLTNDKTPTLQGKVPAGASADVTIDGVSYPVTVDPSGNWTFTQPNNLPDGTYTPVLHVTQGGQTSSTPLDPFTIDTVPASVVLSSNTSTLAPGQPATLTFTFSEVVNGFTAADLTVTGGAVTGLTQSPTDPKVWTATFTPAATGTVATVTLPSGKFSDAAGNLNTDGADPNNTLTLLTNASVTGQLSPASDNATGVPNDNKTSDPTPELIGKVPAGSTATVTLAGQTYPVSVNPDGSYSFTPPVGLPDGTYTPVLNVTTAGVTSATPITPFTIDTVAPTVEVTASRTNLAGGLTAQLTFTLSEASTDFSVADIQSTGGTLSGFAQSATNPLVYTATFTPTTGAMSGQVSVASTTFSDRAGNLNEDGADANNSVDFVLRSVQSGGYNPGASATGELAPTSDTGEKGDGITNDPTPTIEGKVPAGSTATITLAGQTYPVEVNPDGSYNFTPPAGLPDGTYTPALNVTTNGVTTATPITPFTIDTTPPTIAISADKTQLLAGQTALITFTLSEEVSDFAAADIAVSGGTLSGFAQSSTDPKVYTATFTPSANSSANSVIRVASGEFSDAANNFNADGADANNTLSIPTNTLANGATAFLAPSSDSGTPGDATTNDNTPTLTGSVPPGATATMSVAGQIYPVTVNPDGTYSFTLPTGLPDGTYTPQITVTPTGGGAPVTSPGTPFTIDTTAPTVAITSSATSLVTGQTAPITFTLSEASSDFTLADVSVTGGTLSGLVQSATDPKVYTATFTPAAGRTAPSVISVASFKFSDAAGNFNADGSDANNTLTLPTNTTGPDAVAPTIAITADRTQLLTGQTALVTFTLSEASSDFTAADVTVSGGALSGFAQSSTDPKVYTATFTPSANSTANSVISVASGKFSDAAGNQNADGADANNTLSLPTNTSAGLITGALDPSSDTGKPGDNATVDTTPTISGTAPAGATVEVRIPAQNGQPEQVLTATADPDGQYSVNVPTGLLDGTYTPQITVTPTNGSPTTVQGTPFTIDTTPPTIAISASASTLAQGQTSTISFTLSEASSDFTLADVTVSGGTLSNFAGSGTSYSATFTPHASSTANGVISVASARFSDAAGNQNADGSDANNTVTLTVNTFNVSSAAPDTTPPAKPTTPSSYADNTGTTQSPATTAPVTDDTTPALNIGNVPTGETPSLYVDGVKVPATYDPATGTLTPDTPLTPGAHQLTYTLTDAAGNESVPSAAIAVTIDSTPPTVIVTSSVGSSTPLGSGQTATITFTLSDAASDFTLADISVSGGTLGALTQSSTDPKVYTATYTPLANSTTPVTISVASSKFSDAAGNLNTDGADTNNSVTLTVDTQAPAAPSTAPGSYGDNTGAQQNPTSSAPATDDTTPSLNIGAVPTGTTPSLYVDGVKVPATYNPSTGTLTPNSPLPEGAHQITYTLTDAAGNESAPSPAMPLTVDTTPPTIAISTNQSSLVNGQTATITFTLSEASSNFVWDGTTGDITVTGGTLGAITQSSTNPLVYTATFTPTANSTANGVISVASTKFSDAAGNQNADGSDTNNTVTLSVNTLSVSTPSDTTPPTIAITSDKTTLGVGQTATITFTLSEASSDFTDADVQITGGGSLGTLVQSSTNPLVYTATYTPATNSTTPVTISVASDKFKDAAGNFNKDGADSDNSVPLSINTVPSSTNATATIDITSIVNTPLAAQSQDTGTSATDFITQDDSLVYKGTVTNWVAGLGDRVMLDLYDTSSSTPVKVGSTFVTPDSAGNWIWNDITNVRASGKYTLEATIVSSTGTTAINSAQPTTVNGNLTNGGYDQQVIVIDKGAANTDISLALSITTDANNNGTVGTTELAGASTFTSRATFDTTKAQAGDKLTFSATNGSTGLTDQTVTLSATDVSRGYVDVTFNKPNEGATQTVTVNYTDAAGNVATDTKPQDAASLDTTAPTIALSTSATTVGSGQGSNTATITFTLSEASTNFDATDVAVTGGTLSNFAGSGTTYTATFTPTAGQTSGTVSVASSKFSDAGGNQNADGAESNNTQSLIINVAPVASITSASNPLTLSAGPEVTITDNVSGNAANGATVTYTLKFSEAINPGSLSDSDLLLTNGTLVGSSLSQVDATTWTVQATTPTGTAVGVQALSVLAGSYVGLNGVTGMAGSGTQAFGTSTALVTPSINGTVGQSRTATGWTASISTPDLANYTNSTWGYNWAALEGTSTDGGEFALFLNAEAAKTTLTGLTAGQTYTIGFEWQVVAIPGIMNGTASGGTFRIAVDGKSQIYESTASNLTVAYNTNGTFNTSYGVDGWQKAFYTFTAQGGSAVLEIGTNGKGMVVADSLSSTNIQTTQNANLSLMGTSAADTYLIGADGDDQITGAGGADTIYAGAGNDVITLNTTNVTSLATAGNGMVIDGGSGVNELVISNTTAGSTGVVTLDLTNATVLDKLQGINSINVTGPTTTATNNTLKLDYNAVAKLAATADVGTTSADESKMLVVNGNTGDILQLAGTWTAGASTSGSVLAATYGAAYGFNSAVNYVAYTLNGATVFVASPMTVQNSQMSTSTSASLMSQGISIDSLFGASFSDSNTTSPINNFNGVAITSAGTTSDLTSKGKYQLSKDGGTTWFDVAAGLTDDTAIYAAKGDLIRFVGATATANPQDLVVRLVDGYASSTLATGDTVDANPNGGMTAYSGNTVTLTMTPAADTTAPGIVVTSSVSNLNVAQTSTITFTLSEPSTDFDVSDVAVTGGTLSNFSGSGSVYTATFTPDGTSTSGSVSVASNKFSDAAGNFNTDGAEANNKTTMSIGLDGVAPTVAITRGNGETTAAFSGSEQIVFTFSEAIDPASFDSSDVYLVGGTLNGLAPVLTSGNATAGYTQYTATFVPDGSASVSIGLASGKFADMAGNLNKDTYLSGVSGTTYEANNIVTASYSATGTSTYAFKLNAEVASDGAGISVSNAGDVNGDGLDDMIVGSKYDNPSLAGGENGRSYVVFGSTSPNKVIDLSSIAAGSGGFAIEGIAVTGAQAGRTVNGGGDFNGDGLTDLVVSAHGDTSVYVVYGKADGSAVSLEAIKAGTSTSGFMIDGTTAATANTGWSTDVVGDYNGDGIDDILISEPGAGAAYLVYGKQNNTPVQLSSFSGVTTQGFRIDGMATGTLKNWVSAGGDINGDGLNDIVIGDQNNIVNGVRRGAAYVLFGTSDNSPVTATALGDRGYTIYGNSVWASLGDDITIVGDVNGDGLADIAVSDVDTYPRTYILYGKTTTDNIQLTSHSTIPGNQGFIVNSDYHLSGIGSVDATHNHEIRVSAAGDFNGDGLDDFMVGDHINQETYLIFGKAGTGTVSMTGFAATDGIKLQSFIDRDPSSAYSGMGMEFSAAGDVNGDGFEDLILGVVGQAPGGVTYVIYGGQYGSTGTSLVDYMGGIGADTLTGTSASEQFMGSRGSDTLIGGGGADVMYGGEGNDTLVLNAGNVTELSQTTGNQAGDIMRLDGGTGIDTLKLDGAGLTLDLTQVRNEAIQDIEHIDLTATGAQMLKLNLTDVIQLGSSNIFNVNTSANDVRQQVMVTGDSTDTLQLENLTTEWTKLGSTYSANGRTYDVYNHNTANAQLLVAQGMVVQAEPQLYLNVGATAGAFTGTATRLDSTGSPNDIDPDIITLADGSYVVGWYGPSNFVQKFDSADQKVGTSISLGTAAPGGQLQMAAMADGGYVTVSGDGQTIYVKRFDSANTLVTTKTLDTASSGDAYGDITVLKDGGYVVSWVNNNDIKIQRYSSSNTAVGSTLTLDGNSTFDSMPNIKATPDGGYVVVWDTPSSYTDIFVQKFDVNNNTLGAKAILKNPNDGTDRDPDLAVLSDGSYVVTWYWWPNNGQGNVYVQKFNSNGTLAGSQITLSGPGAQANWDIDPTVTALNDGGYVVAWAGYSSGEDIFIQRFDKDNNLVGTVKQIQGGNNDDKNPEVVATTDGGYVVVWSGLDTSTNNDNVYVQKYGSDNNPVGATQKIFFRDQSGFNDQVPQVTATPDGGFVVTWQAHTNTNSAYDIFVQAFDSAAVPSGTTTGATGTFTITSSLSALPASQSVTDYVVTYPSGALTVGGVSYASGSTIAKATWDAAVAAKTVLLTGASATNYSFTLVANVSDSSTGLSFPVTVNQMGTGLVSPLVIDLNGDGVQTLGLDQGVAFDLSGSGTKVQTGWVDRHDGLLAMDLNHDGLINSGAELFGNGTLLANGNKAADGWAALAGLDSNADGLINALDAQFANLRVWRDADTDGVTDAGELLSLADAGIASISLAHDASVTAQNGNLLSGKAVVTHTDGSTTDVTDAWLATEDLHTVPVTIDLSQVIHGNLADLTNARAEVLQIKVNDLLQLPSTAAGEHQVEVLGDAVDTVKLDSLLVNGQPSGAWSQAGAVAQNGHMFNVYQYSGDQSLQVLIDQHIAQSNVHLS